MYDRRLPIVVVAGLLGVLTAGCMIPVPFDQGGHVVICTTKANERGFVYATDEAGGCPFPVANPAFSNTAEWCRVEPAAVVEGDPLCIGR